MALRSGDMVGDYRVLDQIGTGGMGHVYKVQNVLSNRVEAMKVVIPDKSDELNERFLREIQVQASLIHPNITGLHTALRIDGQVIMIMELVEGETVKDRLERGPMRIGECLEYGRQILDALAFAHRREVVHRDIKPANIMLTHAGQAKLMDFGLASAGFDRRLTRSGMVMGSLYYMAPEQVRGEGLSPKSDLYSFGLTLYEMLTGVRGIQGDSDYAIMTAHLQKTPDAPSQVNPSVSTGLSDLVLRAIAKDPAERFASAEEFRDALEKFARSAPEPVMEAVVADIQDETQARKAVPAVTPVSSTNLKPEQAPPRREIPVNEETRPQAVPANPKKSGTLVMVGAAAAVVVVALGVYKFTSGGNETPQSQAPAASAVNPKPADAAPQSEPAATAASAVPASAANSSAKSAAAPVTSAARGNSAPSNPAANAAPVSANPAPVAEPPKPPQKTQAELLAEEASRAWELIASSSDPAVLRSFQSKYPQSPQAAEAVTRADKLEADAAAAANAQKSAEAAAALRKEVVAVLQRLELAYSARNMLQIRLIWPTISEEHVKDLEQAFKDSRMVSLTLEPNADPRAIAIGAMVNCRYVLAMPQKGGGPRRVQGGATVRMRRTNGALVVETIDYHVGTQSLYKPL